MSEHALSAGNAAPAFELPASTGETIRLKDLRGSPVVLYFYPKADTSGCTTQACGFRDAIAGFDDAGTKVIGISPDPIEKVKKFALKYLLNFPLLADADHAVCERYGVWTQKSMYGRKYMGVARTTFLIDPRGKILHIFQNVKPAGHDREVLEQLSGK